MNLFKKKYKKSEWFEGLLWAEKIVKDSGLDDLRYYVDGGANDPLEFESDRGATDYYYYHKRYLK